MITLPSFVKFWKWPQLTNFWLLLALMGLLIPRFANFSRFLEDFLANNFLDILLSPADIVIFLLLLREFFRQSVWLRITVIGLFALGVIQIFLANPSLPELADNWLFTARFGLWIVVFADFFKTSFFTKYPPASLAQTAGSNYTDPKSQNPRLAMPVYALLGIVLLYSFFDHLLLSNPIAVLLAWAIIQISKSTLLGQENYISQTSSQGSVSEDDKSQQLAIQEKLFWRKPWFWLLPAFFLINAITSAWQVFSGQSLGLHFLGEPYLGAEVGGIAKQPIGNFAFVLIRGYGLMQHPNVAGFVGSLGAWFVISVLSQGPTLAKIFKKQTLWWWKVIFISSFILAIFSFSRIAWLSLAWLGLIYFVSSRYGLENLNFDQMKRIIWENLRKYWWAGLGFGSVFLYVFLSRFAYEHSTDNERIAEYFRFFEAWSQLEWWQKLIGTGLGQYPYYLRTYNPQWFWWEWQPIHNLWLSLFFELGILGFGVLVLVVVYICISKPTSIIPDNFD
jgi:hypothetical protein